MTTEVDICNRALAEIAAQSTVSSIQPSDGSPEANACSLLYYPTRDALLRSAHWDFARGQVALTQLKASTDTNSSCPTPWAYEYAYPSNCLKARFMQPNFSTVGSGVPPTTATTYANNGFSNGEPIRFFVGTDLDASGNDSTIILSNQPQATLVFTKRIVNPDLFDPQFQEALVAALKVKLVPALNSSALYMKQTMELAKEMIDQARITNGNEGPMVMNLLPDWIKARGAGYGTFGTGYFYLGYDNMSFPSLG